MGLNPINNGDSGLSARTTLNQLIAFLGTNYPAALTIGGADVASPAAQTLNVPGVVGGTLNGPGAAFTVQGSLPTGSAVPGLINFNTSYAGTPGATVVTISIASPAVFSATNHGFFPGQSVLVSTTGALPTGLSLLTTYYISAFGGLLPNSFQLLDSLAGSFINTSGSQSGVQTVTPGGVVTISIANPAVFTLPNHSFAAGQIVRFQTTGALPTGLSINTNYFILGGSTLHTSTFQVSATLNGTPVATSGSQSGTQTVTINQTSTQQNTAATTVQIGPSKTNTSIGPTGALIVTQDFFGQNLVGGITMFQLNATGNLDPSVDFLQFNANGTSRFVTGYQTGFGSFSVLSAAVGELVQLQMQIDGQNTQMRLGVDSTPNPFLYMGGGAAGFDVGLQRPAANMFEVNNTTVGGIGFFRLNGVTVSSLPTASATYRGARGTVTDATQTLTAGIGAVVVGGGGNTVPVFCDSANWRIG